MEVEQAEIAIGNVAHPLEQGQEQPLPPSVVTEVTKRKPVRKPSKVWKHFDRIKDLDKAKCKYCGKQYAANSSSHGTSNMIKHLKVCLKNPNREVDKRQKTIAIGKESEDDPNSVSLKLVDFNQERTRMALAKMVIIDELPFKYVENEGFKMFMSEAQPRFKIPSRVSVARDCLNLYFDEKEKLKSILSANKQMVSLTTDTWTSIQNMNYMVVTAHYIDDEWDLKKRILSFGLIADHKGETIGINLENCMKDWGIKSICCVTVDNASANNLAISYLNRGMRVWNGRTLFNGEYLHMRCNAHILNLIVVDGLKEIDVSVSRIRAACKFAKASPTRLTTIKKCADAVGVSTKALVTLDVQTRWNSTYIMLDIAEKYEHAFYRLENDDVAYVTNLGSELGGCPNQADWERARVFVKFLKTFYDATLSFSGSLHVTTNSFFKQLMDIQKALNKWRHNISDPILKKMATNMQVKLNKYWESGAINFLLFVAVYLDPRYKLEYIEFCLSRLYGVDKSKDMLNRLNDLINKLFEHYKVMYPISYESNGSGASSSNNVSQSRAENGEDDDDWDNLFRMNVKKKQRDVQRTELERYLEDGLEDTSPTFNILTWWKGKTNKYNVLSRIARDILAIPVSTVSSESAFSTGGRVLDSFRSSLNPSTIEALICTQNWIKSPKVVDLESELVEVEKIESEFNGLVTIDVGVIAAEFDTITTTTTRF
ncbi:cellulase [Trifolium repens]|nr:cellulase [Trifolium repens]